MYRIYEYSGYNGVCFDIALYIYAVMVNYLAYSTQSMVMDVRCLYKCHYFPLVLFVVSISILFVVVSYPFFTDKHIC